MDNPSSPLDTLRQLKEMLDAGALTPTEFEALKQRLVFQAPSAPAAPVAPGPPPVAEVPGPPVPPVRPPAEQPTTQPFTPSSADAPRSPEPAYVPPIGPAPHRVFDAEASVPPPVALPPLTAPAPESDSASAEAADDFSEAPAPGGRNPLALILSIGGALVLLALVLYLTLDHRPSERISSTSLTPADTLAVPIETGPQAQQLPTAAAPETIRVAPANPAPVVPSRSEMEQRAAAVRDSAVQAPASASDSVASQ